MEIRGLCAGVCCVKIELGGFDAVFILSRIPRFLQWFYLCRRELLMFSRRCDIALRERLPLTISIGKV